MNEKYLKEENIMEIKEGTRSFTWCSIHKAAQELKEGYSCRLGNGNNSFWYENWSG